MRLTPDQAQAIRERIRIHMGKQARIWLFGSRADDSRLGGDTGTAYDGRAQIKSLDIVISL